MCNGLLLFSVWCNICNAVCVVCVLFTGFSVCEDLAVLSVGVGCVAVFTLSTNVSVLCFVLLDLFLGVMKVPASLSLSKSDVEKIPLSSTLSLFLRIVHGAGLVAVEGM